MRNSFAILVSAAFSIFASVLCAQPAKPAAEEAPAVTTTAPEAGATAERAAAGGIRPELSLPNFPAEDFTGDTLTVQTTTPGFNSVRAGGGTNLIALAGTNLEVMYEKDENLFVRILDAPCGPAAKSGMAPTPTRTSFREWIRWGKVTVDCSTVDPEIASRLIRIHETYSVKRTDIQKYGSLRSGYVYGLLLAPYKYHVHDKSFSTAVTIGPYAGIQLGNFGSTSTFVVSIGLSSLSVPDGSGGTSTLQGYSAALGFIWTLTKGETPLQLGVLVGKDWAGSNSAVPYTHEGKTWIAAQVGFSFGK